MANKKDPVETAIRKALGSAKSYTKGTCPGDNTVTAYLEGGLSSSDRSLLEDHASTCMNCQELLALSTKLLDVEKPQEFPAKASAYRGRRVLLRLPLPALALLLMAVAIGIIFRDERDSHKQAERTYTPQTGSVSTVPPQKEAAQKPEEASKLTRVPPSRTGGELETEASRRTKERSDKSIVHFAEEKQAAAPPVAEPKSVVLKDASADFRTREKRNESAAAGLKKDENLAAPSARASARELQMQPVGQAVGEISPKNAIAGLSQQNRRQERDYNKAAQNAADRVALAGWVQQRKVGNRIFHLASGYWIDAQCGEHPNAEIVDIHEESPEYAEIRKEIPEIEELRPSGIPILLHWKSRNYIIRQ